MRSVTASTLVARPAPTAVRHPVPVLRRVILLAGLLVIVAGTSVVAPVRAASPGASSMSEGFASPGPLATLDPASGGPWAVGEREVVVAAGQRSFGAWVLYPAEGANGGREAARATGPFPVVVFGHGYLSPVEFYASTLRALASWGFLVVAPRSGGELFPDHAAYAADFSAVLDWVAEQDADSRSWLAGGVTPGVAAASGHSMGGGASLLAAAADPRFTTVANLAAAETRPSAIEAAAAIRVPALLVAGELDAIAPPVDHQVPMFEVLTGAPAQLRTIIGGSHCGFTDPDGGVLGDLAGLVCDTASIPVDQQLAITHRLLVDWLRLYLTGAQELEGDVWSASPGDGTTIELHLP
jgi:dienelactone hydrolase